EKGLYSCELVVFLRYGEEKMKRKEGWCTDYVREDEVRRCDGDEEATKENGFLLRIEDNRRREGEYNRWSINLTTSVFAFEAILRQQPLLLTFSRFFSSSSEKKKLPLSLNAK